jgi:SAM-dependent methyltransferase
MADTFRRWRHQVFGFNVFNRREWVAAQAKKLPPGSRVLDVGAGPGQYRELFAHCEYRTQDFGQEPGTIGRYTQLDYESDITAIPVDSASFDAIVCTEVIEHVPDPVAAIREMSRILKPGGRVFLTAPLASFLHQEPYHFYGGYTPYWYRRFLPEVGIDVEEIESNQGFFSLYGQETLRYVELLGDPAVKRLGIGKRIVLAMMRLAMLPLSRMLPLAGYWLDGMKLETMATIGYHVIGVKRANG